MLEWLLNVDPGSLARGRLTIEWSWAAYGFACAGIAAATVVLGVWAGPRRGLIALIAVRSVLLALLLLVLLRPVLVVDAQVPRPGEVAVLLDDSLSMRIADQPRGRRRGEELERLFAPARGTVSRALEARFRTRYFRFSDRLRPLGRDENLEFSGASTRLATALDRVARTGPAAVVVVSDGAGSDRDLAGTLSRLREEGIAVYAVAIGAERYPLDLDLAAVRLPDSALRGEVLTAEIALEQRGLAGAEATVRAEVDSAIVWERTVRLTEAASHLVLRPRLRLTEPGPHRVTFRVLPAAGEILTGNNVAERMVRVRARPLRVLHFEGEPRFEVKFVRRALGEDEGIELVSLVRTAENRFYQLGEIEGAHLEAGLPRDEAVLFRFDAVVLGSVAVGQLSAAQSAALTAFVARRGGGLLVLGGPRSLVDRAGPGSPLAALLPVVPEAGGEPGFREQVAVRPTSRGLATPVLRTATGEPFPWERLPPLVVVNPLRAAKPGASIWLEGVDRDGGPLVVLASHRYGRGTVAVLAATNTWRWRMHSDVPPGDRTHETLWRNLVRWVGAGAGPPQKLRIVPGMVAFGEPLEVEAELLDETFRPRERGAEIRITTPLGEVLTRPLETGSRRLGLYRAEVAAPEVGVYEVALGEPGSERAYALVSDQGDELHRAELGGTRLRALAERTGGRFLTAADAGSLPGLIDDRRGTRTVERRIPLGRAPLLLLSLLLLACCEWGLRRRWSLP